MSLTLAPITLKAACFFIDCLHRHHKPPQGYLWAHSVINEQGEIAGVAVVGRPVARRLQDGFTCEVTRLCTNGEKNACSMLYAAARRAAIAKGYRRGLTYILETENGASLRAAGWKFLGESPGGSWSVPSREREDKHPTCPKHRYGWGEWSTVE